VRQELGGLNPANRVFDQLTELLPLFLGDGGPQVLNFDQPLANEDNLSDLGDAGHPRVADKLGIERQETVRFLGIASRASLPLQKASGPVQFADGVDVRHEVVGRREVLSNLDLKVASRLMDKDNHARDAMKYRVTRSPAKRVSTGACRSASTSWRR
jgi:hypothetical protein